MTKQTIYVAGYPKSGTTYLTRLLGDVLNSPTGGCMPELDHTEIATEGQDRPGDYIIRKGHFTLINDDSPLTVPYPHKLNWQRLTNEKIVFIVRDPRDICVSGAYHWRQDVSVFLDRMIRGDVAKCGRWDRYTDNWSKFLDSHLFEYPFVGYEGLVEDTYDFFTEEFHFLGVLYQLGVSIDENRIREAIERQSFQTRKSQIGDNEQELRRNNMRKGIIGDWRNHFTKEMNDRIWLEFGWIMERLGYSK